MSVSNQSVKVPSRQEKEIPIDDSPFFKSLRKRTQSLYVTKSGKPRKRFNQKDKYQRDILEICLRISSLLETLRLSRFFLAERLDDKLLESHKVNNSAFIRYHIEAYFLRLTTFKDLILKLSNRTYKFEIKENVGLERNLKKQISRDNLTELEQLLIGLDILMKNIEPIRHKIAHGGYHDDIDLILIEAEETINRDNYSALSANKEYLVALNSLLKRNIIDMYNIETMMATYVLLVYKKLYTKRKEIEKGGNL